MSEAGSERRISAVALAVTAVIVVVMAIWGYQAATAPIEDDSIGSTPVDSRTETCPPGETQTIVKFLRSDQVVVSVYNAGKRQGRAVATLSLLEDRGFQAGAFGNASDATVRFAEIHAKASDLTKADLVALHFGKNATVVIEDEQALRGPGVNVVIGDGFRRLKAGAPRRIQLPEPVISCG